MRKMRKKCISEKEGQALESQVAEALKKAKNTVAVAESCTAGLISERLTNISGSSQYFSLGLVAYKNEAKQSLLNISESTLKQFGAVSKEVARLMAKKIRQLAKTDIGLGVTGIAGPKGATKTKPVGLVFIALASARKNICQKFYFPGNRSAVRFSASQAALEMIRRYLLKNGNR